MDERPRLEAESLGYRVAGRSLLDDVALRVAPGEFVGLVGPNGAGKTTLLRAIAGLLAPSCGRVRLEGRALERLDPRQLARIVAHVPQSTRIDFGFTCLEVVLMGRHPHLGRFALEGPADYRVAEAAMAFTGTSDLAERPITAVSGGEQQRVLAARALAQEPRLLLLDEPTANLDVLHRLQLLDLVRDLVRARGLSAIAAIHDLELAARYCDRLVLLKDGRVLAEGPPAAVLTPERIRAAFGVRAVVRPDPLTGGLSIAVLAPEAPTDHHDGRGRAGAVTVVGVGPGDPTYLTARARDLIASAEVVVGFRSVLDVVQPSIRGRTLALDYRSQEATLQALAAEVAVGRRCVVCLWGDPSVSGRELVERVRQVCGAVAVEPGISSVQIACARAGLAIEEVLVVTLHARHGGEAALAELVEALRAGRRSAIVLPRPWDLMPAALARWLLAEGIAGRRPVVVYERLTLDGEREHRLSLAELAGSNHPFSDLSIIVFPVVRDRGGAA
jgi:iron complex transport system ATP-binding protein